MNIITVSDWELICAVCHWSYTTNIPKNIQNEAYAEAWKHTDAYGEKGFMPAQGYDWSGFRDSSKASTAASANAIRVVLAKHSIVEFRSEKRN